MLAQQDNDTQILEQMRKINERMYMLERKMDVLADLLKGKQTENKPAPKVQNVSAPSKPLNPMDLYAEESNQHQHSHQHQHNHQHQRSAQRNHQPQNHHKHAPKERPMYEAICADCKQECSIPFKPTGDRPVYCKDCFSRRKNPNAFKAKEEEKPLAVSQIQPAAVAASPEVKKQKPKKTNTAAKTKKKTVTAKKAAPKKSAAKKSKRK